MKFRDLAIGSFFVFASERDPAYRFSGLARGPWQKGSARTYFPIPRGLSHKVGSVNVDVIETDGKGNAIGSVDQSISDTLDAHDMLNALLLA